MKKSRKEDKTNLSAPEKNKGGGMRMKRKGKEDQSANPCRGLAACLGKFFWIKKCNHAISNSSPAKRR